MSPEVVRLHFLLKVAISSSPFIWGIVALIIVSAYCSYRSSDLSLHFLELELGRNVDLSGSSALNVAEVHTSEYIYSILINICVRGKKNTGLSLKLS